MGLPIPTDWDGVSKCCLVVEWPASREWLAVFLGFITTPSVGRTWDGATGSIVDAQEVGRQIIEDNSCLWEGFTMGCFEDLIAAINAQSQVIANIGGSSCSGSQNSGLYEANPSAFVDDGADFPSGYIDRAEYDAYKCDLAELVRQRIVTSLDNISILNLAGMTASALISGVGLTSLILVGVPFVNIIAIAGFLLAIWAAQGTLQSAMQEAKDYLNNTFSLCLIYDAQTVSDAQQAILDDIDGQSWTLSVTSDVLKNMFTYDALNLAFDDKPPLEGLPSGDCSGCGAPCDIVMVTGTQTGQNVFQSAMTDPDHWFIHLNTSGVDVDFTFGTLTGFNPQGSVANRFRVFKDGSPVYSSNTYPSGQTHNGDQIILGPSTTDFSVVIDNPCSSP